MQEIKRCPKCKKEKSKSEFYKNKKCKDGLRSWCKKCCDEDNKSRVKKWFSKNREYLREKNRNWRNKNNKVVLDRDNNQCQECNSTDDLTIHHKDHKGRNYINKGLKPNNEISNLVTLCRKCHGSLHGKENSRPIASISKEAKWYREYYLKNKEMIKLRRKFLKERRLNKL